MAQLKYNLLQLNIDKIFEEHTIEEILEIEKLLTLEIERKRNDLRGMVGDRYKDVLTASDAIKSMKSISENIVTNIEQITKRCEFITADDNSNSNIQTKIVDQKIIDERILVMQIYLAKIVNSQIWLALEQEDYFKAAQLYLLVQHIHTGLQLIDADTLSKLPILKRMKSDVDGLRIRILQRVKQKLQVVESNPENTSSNLNTLVLLEQYQNDTELISIFIQLRKTALTFIINESHSTVRAQISVMLKCLINTVYLLHECFINFQNTKRGLIWQQLDAVINGDALPSLSIVSLPSTPLIQYIPELTKHFKPQLRAMDDTKIVKQISVIMETWLKDTQEDINKGLKKCLELITNVKALHIIREESLKIELPQDWDSVCNEMNLAHNFNIWYNFFQTLITNRAKILITKKVLKSSQTLQDSFINILIDALKGERSESDLRWYIWKEEEHDVSRAQNKHTGLSMKTRGYSANIAKMCMHFDQNYLELLEDMFLYLYGYDYNNLIESNIFMPREYHYDKKYIDRNELQNHLIIECRNNSYKLTEYLENYLQTEKTNDGYIIKSLVCARFLQALMELCPHFKKCCSCDSQNTEWEKICNNFQKYNLQFCQNWVKDCLEQTEIWSEQLENIGMLDMLHILPKWDVIEIQEQTDEKIFKSQIKLPSQPSLYLYSVLTQISNQMSAVIPHTLSKQIHTSFVEANLHVLLQKYEKLATLDLNQIQALQFLFDVKFLTTLCIARENINMVSHSQNICDKLRGKIDPFDLDVFYSHLQSNVKICVLQSQVILGHLLPSVGHLATLGILEKNKFPEKDPSVLALSVPSTSWFPLLPVTSPFQKITTPVTVARDLKTDDLKEIETIKKGSSVSSVRSGAAAFFGAMTNDWFS